MFSLRVEYLQLGVRGFFRQAYRLYSYKRPYQVGNDVVGIFTKRDNISITYNTFGNGEKKVLFIAGLGLSSSIWKHQVEYFLSKPELLEKYQICTFNNIGIGSSTVPKGMRYTISQQAQIAMELVQHLGWKKVNLVGISMGGVISQNMMERVQEDDQNPQGKIKIESIILMNTFLSMLQKRSSNFDYPGIFNTYMACLLWCLFKTLFSYECRINSLLPHLFTPDWVKDNEEYALETCRKVFHQEEDFDVTGAFRQFLGVLTYAKKRDTIKNAYDRLGSEDGEKGVPVMIICGEKDRIVHPKNSEYLFKMYGNKAKLMTVKDAGHIINVQYPKIVNDIIFKFLGDVEKMKMKKNKRMMKIKIE